MSRIEERWRALYACPLLILVFDSDGRVIACNSAAEHVLGWTESEVRGQYHPAVPGDTRVLLQPLLAQAAYGGLIPDVNLVVRCKDGSTEAMDVLFFPIYDATERAMGVAAIRVDQTELQRSERQVRSILETMADAFYTLDRDWRFTYVNHAAEFVLQRSRADLLGKNVWEEFPEARNLAVYTAYHQAVVTNLPVSFEEYYQPLDLWAEVRVYPSPTGLSVYFTDINGRKNAEEQMRRYVEAVRQMPISIYIWRAEQPDNPAALKLVATNPAASVMTGVPMAHLLGKTIGECFPNLLATERPRIFQDIALGGEQQYLGDVEYEDDRVHAATFSVNAFPLPNQCVGVAVENVSERRALGDRLQMQARLLNSVGQAVIATAPDGTIIYLNRAAELLYGFTTQESIGRNVVDVFHTQQPPEEVQRAMTALRSGEERQSETLIRRKDGRDVPVLVHTTPVRSDDGVITGIIGVSMDVTRQRQSEAELRASEARYRSVVETSPDGIAVVDAIGTIVVANRQLSIMLGYESSEMMPGIDIRKHLPAEERERAEHMLKQRVVGSSHRILSTQYDVMRRDGSTFPADVTSMVLPHEVGQPLFTMSTVRDASERVAYETQLQYLALHDPLSGLANRTLLDDRLQVALADARRFGSQLAVLVLDLDRFKEINDTYGHHVGDDVLHEVSARLKRKLRESDTLARLGGDEYAILLPHADLEAALQTATKLSYVLEQPIDLGDQRLYIGASFGIALYPDHADNAASLLRQADVAMYTARSASSGYAVYDVEKDSYSPTRLSQSGELREAIQANQLVLHYQPKLEVSSGRIVGVEALIRWNHPVLGIVSPDRFVPLAEHSGLIRPLTAWVLREALTQCQTWRSMDLDVGIAINVSARSLHDLDFPMVIEEFVANSEVPPGELTIEITESVIMHDPERAMIMLTQLTDAGIKFSIDDFGTGYSSLAYLRQLRVNELKIDKSFVMDLDISADNVAIVRSVVELGHNLGLEVVAEGVESQTAMDILVALRCDRAQGFYLSRPLPALEMTAWLQNWHPLGESPL